MTGQGGWPMTVFLTPDGEPFFCGTYFPPTPARACRPSGSCSASVTRGLDGPARRRARAAGSGSSARSPTHRAGRRRPPLDAGRARRGGRPRCGPRTTRATAGSAARRSSRRRWCWSSCCATTPAPATAWTLRWSATARGDGPRRHVRPARRRLRPLLASTPAGSCRTSRRCCTTTRCCCGSTLHLWRATGSPLARRVAVETADFLLARPAHRRGRVRLRAGRRHRRASRASPTPGRRRSCVEVLGDEDGAWAAQAALGHRGGHVRARHVDPAAARRPRRRRPLDERVRAALLRPRGSAAAAGPRRQGRRRLERPGHRRPGRGGRAARASRTTSTPRGAAPTCCCDAAPRRRPAAPRSRDGVVGAAAGVLEDYGDLAEGLLALHQATGEPRWLAARGRPARHGAGPLRRRPGRVLRHRRRRRAAGPPARRTRPTTPTPSGLVGRGRARC